MFKNVAVLERGGEKITHFEAFEPNRQHTFGSIQLLRAPGLKRSDPAVSRKCYRFFSSYVKFDSKKVRHLRLIYSKRQFL